MKCVQTGSINSCFKLDQVDIEAAHPNVLCSDFAYHSGTVTKAYASCLLARQIECLGAGRGADLC